MSLRAGQGRHELRGGYSTNDPRLDRLPEFDERSRNFPVRALLTAEQERKPRSYTWKLGVRLNQFREGACTGFSTTHEAAAKPKPIADLTNDIARAVYHRAKQIDQWPGEDYEGSSVIAAVKAGVERGWYGEYRWAFGIDDLILAVGYKGPAILGINWYTGMFDADADGFIDTTGQIEGGHAILTNRVNVREEYFELPNSWGENWGVADRYGLGGVCRVRFDRMERLLREDGEACIPVVRTMP